MIAIVDYGVGNLFSLSCSLASLGIESEVTGDRERLRAADRLILPGVGAFGAAADALARTGLGKAVLEEVSRGKPLLGVCLGMQLLFERSYEYGVHEGLALIPGEVRPLREIAPNRKIPHMGWNSLHVVRPCPLLPAEKEGEYVYFVHSFAAEGVGDSLLATADYGAPVTALAGKGKVFGAQFHPEKSGAAGLAMLRAFSEV